MYPLIINTLRRGWMPMLWKLKKGKNIIVYKVFKSNTVCNSKKCKKQILQSTFFLMHYSSWWCHLNAFSGLLPQTAGSIIPPGSLPGMALEHINVYCCIWKKKNEMAVAGSHRRVTSIRSSADGIPVNSLMRNLSGCREIPLPSSLWKRFQLNQEIKSISLTRLQNCSALAINLSHLFNDDKSA